MFCLGQSPNLNAIKNNWNIINGKLTGKMFYDEDTLWKAIINKWENFFIE